MHAQDAAGLCKVTGTENTPAVFMTETHQIITVKKIHPTCNVLSLLGEKCWTGDFAIPHKIPLFVLYILKSSLKIFTEISSMIHSCLGWRVVMDHKWELKLDPHFFLFKHLFIKKLRHILEQQPWSKCLQTLIKPITPVTGINSNIIWPLRH